MKTVAGRNRTDVPRRLVGGSAKTRSSSLLSLLLLLPLALPVLAQAQFEYIVESGTATITKYTGPGGDVVIPDAINGLRVGSIADYTFAGSTGVTSVTIPASITRMGDGSGEGAFSGCSSLAVIEVDESNPVYSALDGVLFSKDHTTLVRFPGARAGNYAVFDGVDEIADFAFQGCANLISVTIGDGVRNIGAWAFENCRSLTSVEIPNSVTTIEDRAFTCCSALKSLAIPNGVTTISDCTFAGCTELISVVIPDSVTSIGEEAFSFCSSLTSVDIPNGVTRIDWGAFLNCTSLTNITIADSVTSIFGSAFTYCSGLTSIEIGNGVTSIGEEAFSYCSSLTSITIPESVRSVGECPFAGCINLTGIAVDALNPEYSSLDGVLFGSRQKKLVQFPGGKTGSYTIPHGVLDIGNRAFYGCAGLTSVTVPGSVTSIGDAAFSSCDGLVSVDIAAGVLSIGDWAFASCVRLTGVDLPESVRSIGVWAFSSCSGLDHIKIPKNVTSLGYGAFWSCTNLTAVCFEGDAPESNGQRVFENATPTIYYLPGTTGWGATFGGRPTMPWGVIWGSPVRGDVNGDEVVDRSDFRLIFDSRNLHAVNSADPRDLDGDGKITVLDARILVTLFAVPGGFTRVEPGPQGVALEWSAGNGPVKLQSTSDLRSGLWEDLEGLQSSTNAVIGTSSERMFFRLVLPE